MQRISLQMFPEHFLSYLSEFKMLLKIQRLALETIKCNNFLFELHQHEVNIFVNIFFKITYL